MSNIKIGVAQVDCTPETGLPLMGNFRNDYAARGMHDPLFAHAMVFTNDSKTKLALLSVDVCMLDRNNVSFMRNFISSQCNIAAENIFIASTHTHSGPAATQLGTLPKAEDEQVEAFIKKAATAVIAANENIEEANLAIGHASENRLSFNRRLKCKDGKTHMNWEGLDPDFVIEPLSSTDPEVITLTVDRDNKPKAATTPSTSASQSYTSPDRLGRNVWLNSSTAAKALTMINTR